MICTTGAAAKIFEEHSSWTAIQVWDEMKDTATTGAVDNPGSGSPNLMLYSA